jgi:hypothetical protein
MERTADNQVTVLAASTCTENMRAQHKKEKRKKERRKSPYSELAVLPAVDNPNPV